MKVSEVCNHYFNGWNPSNYKNTSMGTKALAVLEVASYFTLIIPAGFGVAYGISSLFGRASKKPSLTSVDAGVHQKAQAVIKMPAATPEMPKSALSSNSIEPPLQEKILELEEVVVETEKIDPQLLIDFEKTGEREAEKFLEGQPHISNYVDREDGALGRGIATSKIAILFGKEQVSEDHKKSLQTAFMTGFQRRAEAICSERRKKMEDDNRAKQDAAFDRDMKEIKNFRINVQHNAIADARMQAEGQQERSSWEKLNDRLNRFYCLYMANFESDEHTMDLRAQVQKELEPLKENYEDEYKRVLPLKQILVAGVSFFERTIPDGDIQNAHKIALFHFVEQLQIGTKRKATDEDILEEVQNAKWWSPFGEEDRSFDETKKGKILQAYKETSAKLEKARHEHPDFSSTLLFQYLQKAVFS